MDFDAAEAFTSVVGAKPLPLVGKFDLNSLFSCNIYFAELWLPFSTSKMDNISE